MDAEINKIEPAERSKKSARMFTFGNLIAVSFPPFFVLWFGASILVYAIYRHHPNERVGYYTQRAAYYYYGIAGSMIPIFTFAPSGFIKDYWFWVWGVAALVMLVLSVLLLKMINDETWKDIEYKGKA